MSSFEADPEVGLAAPATMELLEGAPVALGGPRGFAVTRTLPNRQRRMVGAWCFLDAYGPHDLAASEGMRVGPHPHTGLQTVTWLVAGEVLHRDSLGNRQLIRPGQLNLMTAGRGISHSEETPPEHTPILHGVQLWVALPHAARDMPPAFAHHADLPVVTVGAAAGSEATHGGATGVTATVLMGTFAGATSPAACYTPLVGAELALAASAQATLPLNPDFEYAVLALDDAAPTVDDVTLKPGPLLYLGSGRTSLPVATESPSRLLLLGGEPFEERLVMWWNFVARDHDEIVQMRADWFDHTPRFGEVHGYDGPPLPAPPMPISRLVPRGRVR
ncbi:pirin family protein [Actinoplanes sp. Pm04-4]|uniref:Pirin family protein n=1 Tax=Paractinoplanes pyxinae TaxID=2997416 RepID=A0ABT4AZN8_9ACTN|nr:pirin family protein [Actinoplanes pyxinae]MCY1139718.1 pirin family protein [Actinoplanes pyxinae]